MNRFLAALALGLLSLPANAATFIDFNGSTGVFGNNLVTDPTFSDSIELTGLTAGQYWITATITSSYQDGAQAEQDIDFTSVMLNGVEFEVGNTGQSEFRFITSILSGNTNLFSISGTSGSNSSYSGTINVASIPEPSTWAMMLLGFGAVAMSLRRRPLSRSPYPQTV